MTILKKISTFLKNKSKVFREYSIQIAKEGVTMYNKVEICGVNTAALPLLSEQEKEDLLMLVKTGDAAARDKLISGNLLVMAVIGWE